MKKRISLAVFLIFVIFFSGCATLGFTGGEKTQKTEITGKHQKIKKLINGMELTYKDDAAQSVSVAGEFNNWDASANQMKKENGVSENR